MPSFPNGLGISWAGMAGEIIRNGPAAASVHRLARMLGWYRIYVDLADIERAGLNPDTCTVEEVRRVYRDAARTFIEDDSIGVLDLADEWRRLGVPQMLVLEGRPRPPEVGAPGNWYNTKPDDGARLQWPQLGFDRAFPRLVRIILQVFNPDFVEVGNESYYQNQSRGPWLWAQSQYANALKRVHREASPRDILVLGNAGGATGGWEGGFVWHLNTTVPADIAASWHSFILQGPLDPAVARSESAQQVNDLAALTGRRVVVTEAAGTFRGQSSDEQLGADLSVAVMAGCLDASDTANHVGGLSPQADTVCDPQWRFCGHLLYGDGRPTLAVKAMERELIYRGVHRGLDGLPANPLWPVPGGGEPPDEGDDRPPIPDLPPTPPDRPGPWALKINPRKWANAIGHYRRLEDDALEAGEQWKPAFAATNTAFVRAVEGSAELVRQPEGGEPSPPVDPPDEPGEPPTDPPPSSGHRYDVPGQLMTQALAKNGARPIALRIDRNFDVTIDWQAPAPRHGARSYPTAIEALNEFIAGRLPAKEG